MISPASSPSEKSRTSLDGGVELRQHRQGQRAPVEIARAQFQRAGQRRLDHAALPAQAAQAHAHVYSALAGAIGPDIGRFPPLNERGGFLVHHAE